MRNVQELQDDLLSLSVGTGPRSASPAVCGLDYQREVWFMLDRPHAVIELRSSVSVLQELVPPSTELVNVERTCSPI